AQAASAAARAAAARTFTRGLPSARLLALRLEHRTRRRRGEELAERLGRGCVLRRGPYGGVEGGVALQLRGQRSQHLDARHGHQLVHEDHAVLRLALDHELADL